MNTKFKQTEIGEIPEDWNTGHIGNLVRLKAGYAIKSHDFTRTGVGVIKIKNIDNRNVDIDDTEKVNIEFANSLHKDFLLGVNDVLIAMTGATIGKVGKIRDTDKKFVLNQRVARFVSDNIDDLEFVFQYTGSNSFSNQIRNNANGAAQQNISATEIADIHIPLPPWEERKNIASILSSLDDKIELNRKMNKTLEDMAKALFKHWFVDFEFPNKEGKPYKSNGGGMVNSELGPIPKEWSTKKLMDIADISIGRTPPRMQAQWFSENPEDIGWLSIRDMGSCGVYVGKTSEYLTKEAVDKFSIPIIPKNTVVLSFKLTVGRVAISTADMLSNEAIAHIKLTNVAYSTEYTYLMLKNFDFSSLGTTSSIATAVNSQSIKGIPVMEPESGVLSNFSERIHPIFSEILVIQKQIDALIKMRDSLLPKLMSGKIRVK